MASNSKSGEMSLRAIQEVEAQNLVLRPNCVGKTSVTTASVEKPSKVFVPDPSSNPTIAGLFGFALTTMCLGLASTQSLDVKHAPVFSMALVFGGACQFVTGTVALNKGWTYEGTVAICFGCSWISYFVMMVIVPLLGVEDAENDLLAFNCLWTLITLSFTVTALKHGLGNFIVFLLLLLSYVLEDIKLLMKTQGVEVAVFQKIIGWVEFLCGFAAWATATAALINKDYGKIVVPL